MTRVMIVLLLSAAATNLPDPYGWLGFGGMGAVFLLIIFLILKAVWDLARGHGSGTGARGVKHTAFLFAILMGAGAAQAEPSLVDLDRAWSICVRHSTPQVSVVDRDTDYPTWTISWNWRDGYRTCDLIQSKMSALDEQSQKALRDVEQMKEVDDHVFLLSVLSE